MKKQFWFGIKNPLTNKIIHCSEDKSVCKQLLDIINVDIEEKKKNYKIVNVTVYETQLTFDKKTYELIRR